MTLLRTGGLAVEFSSVSVTASPIPSTTSFVFVPPDMTFFSSVASLYRNRYSVAVMEQVKCHTIATLTHELITTRLRTRYYIDLRTLCYYRRQLCCSRVLCMYFFCLFLSVCLSDCAQDNQKGSGRILMKLAMVIYTWKKAFWHPALGKRTSKKVKFPMSIPPHVLQHSYQIWHSNTLVLERRGRF